MVLRAVLQRVEGNSGQLRGLLPQQRQRGRAAALADHSFPCFLDQHLLRGGSDREREAEDNGREKIQQEGWAMKRRKQHVLVLFMPSY